MARFVLPVCVLIVLFDEFLAENGMNQNMNQIDDFGSDLDIRDTQLTSKFLKAFEKEKLMLKKTVASVNIQLANFKEQLKGYIEKDEIIRIEEAFIFYVEEFQNKQKTLQTEVKRLTSNNNYDLIMTERRVNEALDELRNKLSIQESQIEDLVDTLEKVQMTNQNTDLNATNNDQENGSPSITDENIQSCSDDWRLYKRFCYQYFEERVYRSTARDRCADVGANLVDFQDMEELTFVKELVNNKTTYYDSYWIGLKKETAEDGEWKWDRTGKVANNTFWLPENPRNYEGIEECAYAYPHLFDGMWLNVGCDTYRTFVCKKTV